VMEKNQRTLEEANHNPLLQVRNLRVEFSSGKQFASPRKQDIVRAVDGVSFEINRGEVLGLVGESGCGKSTICRAILKLIPAAGGEIHYDGRNLCIMGEREIRSMRRRMQMIFQDPYASLNPSMTVYQTIAELLKIHHLADGRKQRERVREMMRVVELDTEFLDRYPHEFSGGQRQRISIARALVVNPEFLVADEPVSSLDVSVQAQIINLLQELQSTFNLTYLFISHDLSVVRHISNRIAIMYLGKIVEQATAEMLFQNPLHPYTRALLSAVPIPDPQVEENRKSIILSGEVPSPYAIPAGCRFNTRCWKRMDVCFSVEPPMEEIEEGHYAACHLYEPRRERGAS
jgi:oligopeptide/dipeptide ABC transporter ATP-binding protein